MNAWHTPCNLDLKFQEIRVGNRTLDSPCAYDGLEFCPRHPRR